MLILVDNPVRVAVFRSFFVFRCFALPCDLSLVYHRAITRY